MYQGTLYQYNQRADILAPSRRGTTYYGPDNHKPLVLYRGLNIEFDFFVKNTDRKPQTLHNRVWEAYINDRNGNTIIRKDLIPVDYDSGKLLLKLDHEETLQLEVKLHDIVIIYNETGIAGSYGSASDQHFRLTFVLDVREGVLQSQPSTDITAFTQDADDYYGGRMKGPAQTANRTGLNTAQVYTTNYTGTYKFQATLSLQPLSSDWFDVPNQSYTVSANTGTSYHNFYGNYYWLRLVHTPDITNTGTLDKVVLRA